jgi:hypothetical protein
MQLDRQAFSQGLKPPPLANRLNEDRENLLGFELPHTMPNCARCRDPNRSRDASKVDHGDILIYAVLKSHAILASRPQRRRGALRQPHRG